MRRLIFIWMVLFVTSKISSQTSNNFSFNQFYSFKSASQFSIQFKDSLDLDIPGEKSPWVAFLFSYIFPGGGQIYNGQPLKGILFLTGFSAGIGVALLGYPGTDFEATAQDKVFFYSGLSLAGIMYLWQLIDAPVSSNSINSERRLKLNKVELGLEQNITDNGFNTTLKVYIF